MNLLKKIEILIMLVGAVLSLYNLYKDVSVLNNYGYYVLIVGLIISFSANFIQKKNKV